MLNMYTILDEEALYQILKNLSIIRIYIYRISVLTIHSSGVLARLYVSRKVCHKALYIARHYYFIGRVILDSDRK